MTVLDLRAFVAEALVDFGAVVTENGHLLWVQAPESVQGRLDVPATFALAFDAVHSGEFGAELVAPGSYFLERLVSATTKRGRWDSVRIEAQGDGWPWRILAEQGIEGRPANDLEILLIRDVEYLVVTFRLTLLADEKRESFHAIVVAPEEGLAWPVDPASLDRMVATPSWPVEPRDVEVAYEIARAALGRLAEEDVRRFRARSLRLLEEEVRRIFGFYDDTIDEIRGGTPSNADGLTRAIEAERGRRLAETLERFEPRALASLCAIRAVAAPTAMLRWSRPGGVRAVQVDAWTQRIRGLACDDCHVGEGPWSVSTSRLRCARCAVTGGESARPQARPR